MTMLKRSTLCAALTLFLSTPTLAQTTTPVPNQQIIDMLTGLLAQAHSGDMQGFAYAATFSGGNFSYVWLGDDTSKQIGTGITTLFAHYNGFVTSAEAAAGNALGFTQGRDAAAAIADAVTPIPARIRALTPPTQ
jgi:hypothetical protein